MVKNIGIIGEKGKFPLLPHASAAGFCAGTAGAGRPDVLETATVAGRAGLRCGGLAGEHRVVKSQA